MDLKEYFQLLLPSIETGIRNSIKEDISSSYPILQEMMNYHFGFSSGVESKKNLGKQIRPVILLLSNSICGGDWKDALPAAISIELIHNFSLIHDDIEDHSDLRRGRKTLWKQYGIAQAINTGDAMFSLAQMNMLKLGKIIDKSVAFDAINKLNETCLILTGGQSQDISFETEMNVSMENYKVMISGKTAALLSASAEIGAICAQSSEGNRSSLREFGEALGLAFQAWDDWLGLWGNEEQTGKSTSSDLVTGKKTLPILFSLDKDGEFAKLYQRDGAHQDNLNILLQLLEKEGAKEFTESLVRQYTLKAENSLNKLTIINKTAFNALKELTNLLINRSN